LDVNAHHTPPLPAILWLSRSRKKLAAVLALLALTFIIAVIVVVPMPILPELIDAQALVRVGGERHAVRRRR